MSFSATVGYDESRGSCKPLVMPRSFPGILTRVSERSALLEFGVAPQRFLWLGSVLSFNDTTGETEDPFVVSTDA